MRILPVFIVVCAMFLCSPASFAQVYKFVIDSHDGSIEAIYDANTGKRVDDKKKAPAESEVTDDRKKATEEINMQRRESARELLRKVPVPRHVVNKPPPPSVPVNESAVQNQKDDIGVYANIEAIPDVLRQQLRRAHYIEGYLGNVLSVIRGGSNRNRSSINKDDVSNQLETSLKGARRAQRNRLISYDIDYDGKITKKEISKAFENSPHNHLKYIERKTSEVLKHDLNKDDIISYEEMSTLNDE